MANIRHNRGTFSIGSWRKIVQKVRLQMRLDKHKLTGRVSHRQTSKQWRQCNQLQCLYRRKNASGTGNGNCSAIVLTVSIKVWLSSQVAMYARMESSSTAKQSAGTFRYMHFARKWSSDQMRAKIVLLVKSPSEGSYALAAPRVQYVLRGRFAFIEGHVCCVP